LAPEEAFGPRNPELVQRVSRAMLAANSAAGESYAPGDLVEFPAPGGGRFAGVLKSIDDNGALFDFNHPLAGQRIRFEVRILGVL
jgi:FKBP-type peptidyl-prolyl cis-trans isomerase SlpA